MHDLTDVPVEVKPDRTRRVKIIDACGLACNFCHNEGTPVAAPGRTGRVSIYLRTNGADFLPARIAADADFALALAAVRGSLPTNEVHFTGGEPKLHPDLPGLITIARRVGLTVGLTSNGENGAAVLPAAAAAGLDRINLSVFGTTPAELAAVQAPRLASPKLAERKLAALDATIDAATAHGVKVSANIVIPDRGQVERVLRIIERHGRSVVVPMLVSLEDGGASLAAMQDVVDYLGALPVRRIITTGASDQRVRYRLPDGRTMGTSSEEVRRQANQRRHSGECAARGVPPLGFAHVRRACAGVCSARRTVCAYRGRDRTDLPEDDPADPGDIRRTVRKS
ncbi:radical SAM protein [Streptomyces sp. NPDC006332]|uniref:radical SAM protein n=1 Tax=Streptomyces sp. NPDC006332 TaxID=3155456 RepID=UPI0033BC91BC